MVAVLVMAESIHYWSLVALSFFSFWEGGGVLDSWTAMVIDDWC